MIELVSTWTEPLDAPAARKAAMYEVAHRALAVQVLDWLRDGGAGIVRYQGVTRQRVTTYSHLVTCRISATIEPYREAE